MIFFHFFHYDHVENLSSLTEFYAPLSLNGVLSEQSSEWASSKSE